MIEPQRSKSIRHLQWAAVVLCAAAIAINYLDRSTIAIAYPQIRKEFDISAAQFGALQSAWSLLYAIAQIPVGFLIDRLGPRMLLGVSLIVWLLAVAAGGLASSYRQLFAARAVLGITESPAYPTAVRVTSNWFPVSERGTPTGVFNMGANIGTALGPPLLTSLMLLFGWRYMFIIMGIVGIVASLIWFWLYRDPDEGAPASIDGSPVEAKSQARAPQVTARQWSRLLRFRTTWAMILGSFCGGYGLWMYVTWLPGYIQGEHHISIAQTGFLASIPLVCSILGSLCGGYISDRLVKTQASLVEARKLPTSLGYLAAALFTALAAYSTGPVFALLRISAAMFFLYFAIAAKWTLITAVSPQAYCSSCSSIQNFGAYLGGTLSPFLTGLIVDQTGSFVLALATGSIIMTAGAATYYFLVRSPITDSDMEGRFRATPALDIKLAAR